MKTTDIIYGLGAFCLIAGLALGFVPSKEYKQSETKPISNERSCAIEAIWKEARGVSLEEKKMVLQVILNRTRAKGYPSTICGVVHQPYQFSYYNRFKENSSIIPEFQSMKVVDKRALLEIEQLVDTKLNTGTIKLNSSQQSSVLFYHTKAVYPAWARDKKIKLVVLDKKFKHKYYGRGVE